MKTIEGQNDSCQFRFKIGFHKIGNQDPYFSITGDTWELGKSRIDRNSLGCGALDINEYFPELGYLQKYHLTSVREPIHYVANSLYHASDRDYEGKEPDLKVARISAVWPDAELSDFTKENLINRLPELMKQFKQDILKAGLEWPEGY